MKTIRVFKTVDKDENDLVLEFRRPTQAVIAKGELISRAKFSEAFRAGVVMNAEVAKLLRDRGLWGDEQEKLSLEYRKKIRELEESLKDATISNEKGKLIVEEIREQRALLDQHESLFRNVADATCETLAQEERNMFYASECIYNKTSGEKVYKNLEDFKARLSERATIDSYLEATIASLEVLIGQELPSDLSTNYEENKWLAERGLNEEETGEDQQDTEKSTEEPVKKKRGRRKKTAEAS